MVEFKSVADSIFGQNGNVAAREEKPREKAVISPHRQRHSVLIHVSCSAKAG